IKLRVTPTQITSDSAQLEISPEVSTVVRFTDPGTSGISNPIVAVRNVRTSLTVKDGEIVTIGGLLRNEDRYAERKVPGIGDLPLIGELFKSKRKEKVKTALVFFLHVTILQQSQPDSILFHKPGSGMKNLDEEVKNLLAPEDLTIPKFTEDYFKDPQNASPNPSLEKKPTFDNVTQPSTNTFAPLNPIIIDVTPPKKEEPLEEAKSVEEKKEEKPTEPIEKTEKTENVKEEPKSSDGVEKESSETKEQGSDSTTIKSAVEDLDSALDPKK
ncbi:MAG: hypothetical protein AABZ60_03005, partial [Planctomycetota bacterium]